ncbi:AAA family ATPase [Thermodesulfovibrio sp.]|uniref:AAA family ATPase n=1 Tax=Thermodesulfovibrio sp. TaxID=2067987 RepID=UPI0030B4DCA7
MSDNVVKRDKNFNQRFASKLNNQESSIFELQRLLGKVTTDLSPEHLEKIFYDNQERTDFFKNLQNFEKFNGVLHTIYPKRYALSLESWLKKFNEKGGSDSEADIFYKILQLPTNSRLSFSPEKIKRKLDSLVISNDSLLEVCETIVGYYIELMRFARKRDYHITLKDLSWSRYLSCQSLLLIGEPGCGKSWIGQIIADILRIPCITIDCASNDYLGVAGSASNWSNSKESILARKMIEGKKFPFIVIFDEVDKTGHSNEHRLIDTINHIIDPVKTFEDPYLNVPLYHLKSFVFILTANDENQIPDYIKSRAYTVFVKPMSEDVLAEYVLKSFNEEVGRIDKRLGEAFKYSDTIRDLLGEIVKIKKHDFRSLKGKLTTIYRRYLSPWHYGKDIKDFFKEELSKEIKGCFRTEKKRIGFNVY